MNRFRKRSTPRAWAGWTGAAMILAAWGLVHAQESLAEPPPATWAEVATRYQTECPAPLFQLKTPETVKLERDTFRIEGSTLTRMGGPWKGPLNLGVLGAVKDASAETRANIQRANKEFIRRGVHVVIANGDVSEGEFDLEDTFKMLGQEIKLPVLAFMGNSEGKGSFNRAFAKASKQFPQLFNLNWNRHVDLGGIHILVLPGYHDLKFLHGRAGCHYTETHIREMERRVDQLVKSGGTVVLTTHSPPRSSGKGAIDLAQGAGNVGDPALTELITRSNIWFGIFGHILEAGGRATSDLAKGTPIKLPMKTPVDQLYFNAGSACSTPWPMLDGSTSSGMAAVMVLDGGKASVEFIKLQP